MVNVPNLIRGDDGSFAAVGVMRRAVHLDNSCGKISGIGWAVFCGDSGNAPMGEHSTRFLVFLPKWQRILRFKENADERNKEGQKD